MTETYVSVTGSGGRETALTRVFFNSPNVDKVSCSPGNAGTLGFGENYAGGKVSDILAWANANGVNLLVPGPEAHPVEGIADLARHQYPDILTFAPSQKASRLESSKLFAKEVMLRSNAPTADFLVFHDGRQIVEQGSLQGFFGNGWNVVLKADQLAGGKGVYVCHTRDQVEHAVDKLFNGLKSKIVLAEKVLKGREASLIVATDGERIALLPTSHDYKRLTKDPDSLNTGGMGSVAPTTHMSHRLIEKALDTIIRPVLARMKAEGMTYKGFLYAGLMIGPNDDLWVLEFNVRLGDPETQSILPLLKTDLHTLLMALLRGDALPAIEYHSQHAVTMVMAARGYPEKPELGKIITGLAEAEAQGGVLINLAGANFATSGDRSQIVTTGGRVLAVTGLDETQEKARLRALGGVRAIDFEGNQFRDDIGNPD